MREILFRGKTETEKWVYGALDNTLNWADFIIVHENGFGIKNRILPETVGQFTGLTDKNGNKIFEGDILRFRANYTNKPCGYLNGIIEINPYKLILRVSDLEYDASEESEGLDYNSEVIGNIHDNPELLK